MGVPLGGRGHGQLAAAAAASGRACGAGKVSSADLLQMMFDNLPPLWDSLHVTFGPVTQTHGVSKHE